jgi:trimeric autotransporter adhesin
VVDLAPTRLVFASRSVGTTSGAQVVTLTNVGTALVDISSIQIGGADAQDFLQSATTCGASVVGGGSCTIGIRFKPTATGLRSATLNVSDDGGGSPQTVALYGTGT